MGKKRDKFTFNSVRISLLFITCCSLTFIHFDTFSKLFITYTAAIYYHHLTDFGSLTQPTCEAQRLMSIVTMAHTICMFTQPSRHWPEIIQDVKLSLQGREVSGLERWLNRNNVYLSRNADLNWCASRLRASAENCNASWKITGKLWILFH
jgi:hypothetical protein